MLRPRERAPCSPEHRGTLGFEVSRLEGREAHAGAIELAVVWCSPECLERLRVERRRIAHRHTPQRAVCAPVIDFASHDRRVAADATGCLRPCLTQCTRL